LAGGRIGFQSRILTHGRRRSGGEACRNRGDDQHQRAGTVLRPFHTTHHVDPRLAERPREIHRPRDHPNCVRHDDYIAWVSRMVSLPCVMPGRRRDDVPGEGLPSDLRATELQIGGERLLVLSYAIEPPDLQSALGLTAAEAEVAELAIAGLSNGEIA